MDQQVTQTYNLFIDSSRNRAAGSKGDDYSINLQDSGVQAGNGEYIRLSLDNFSMAKTFSNTNRTNNRFSVHAQNATNSANLMGMVGAVSKFHYKDTNKLASDFSAVLKNVLLGMGQNAGSTARNADILDLLPVDPNTGSDDNIISFRLLFKDDLNSTAASPRGNAVDHGLQNVRVQFDSDMTDSYALLGGDRVTGTSTTAYTDMRKSIDVDTTTHTDAIIVNCRYPAQLQTTRHVYIRAPYLNNTNIETHGLQGPGDSHVSDTAHSDILGRAEIPFDKNTYISYTAQTGREYFLNLHQKNLPNLRIKLTDQHNRPLGRVISYSNTAAGTQFGLKQSIDGNLQFSAVLRVDIIKQRQVAELESQPYVPSVPPRLTGGVLTQQRGGKDMFGVAPGM